MTLIMGALEGMQLGFTPTSTSPFSHTGNMTSYRMRSPDTYPISSSIEDCDGRPWDGGGKSGWNDDGRDDRDSLTFSLPYIAKRASSSYPVATRLGSLSACSGDVRCSMNYINQSSVQRACGAEGGFTRSIDPCGSFNSPGRLLTESRDALDPASSAMGTEVKLSRLNRADSEGGGEA